jgi:hypothetical protein
MNRSLKTSNEENHEKGFRRFICHVSTGIFGVACFRMLQGPGVSLWWINLLAIYRHYQHGAA